MPLGFPPSIQDSRGQVRPRGRLRINPDHPLVDKDLILAVVPSEGHGFQPVDLSPYRHQWTKPGSSTIARLTGGRGNGAWDFRGGVRELRFAHRAGQPFIADVIAPFTVMCSAYYTGSLGNVWAIGQQTDSNDAEAVGVDASSHVCLGEADSAAVSSTLVVPTNKWSTFGCSQSGASARTFFLNGTAQTNATTRTTSAIGATQPQSIGRYYTNSAAVAAADWVGLIEVLYVWKAAKSTALLQALSTNPFALLTAAPANIVYSYATPAAGPTTTPQGWDAIYPVAAGPTSSLIAF